jgi:hypothetical protein
MTDSTSLIVALPPAIARLVRQIAEQGINLDLGAPDLKDLARAAIITLPVGPRRDRLTLAFETTFLEPLQGSWAPRSPVFPPV